MTSGVLAVVACPMLEDELIHSIGGDPEPKRVIVIDTPYNSSLKRKMEESGIAFETMDEWTFLNGGSLRDGGFTVVVVMNSLGLHAEPKELVSHVQDQLFMMQGRVDAAAAYYGMCGNYGWDVSKWAESNLSYPVCIFRDRKGRVCDDCIGVAVGGLEGYQRLIKAYTGVMLFTPAVATNWVDFLSASDMMKGFRGDRDPQAEIKKILEICGYRSVVQIDTGLETREPFDRCTKDFADYMGFEILQAPDDFADIGPADAVYAEAKRLLDGRKE